MSAELMTLASCAAGLSLCPIPVWVFEVDPVRFCFANDAALELWGVSDRAELFTRDMEKDVPERVRMRTRGIRERIRTGQVVREEWILYPGGVVTPVLLECRALTLPDGRLGMLVHVLTKGEAMSALVERSLTMFRHTGVIGALVGADGQIHMQNPRATEVFGDTRSWAAWLVDASEAEDILRRAIAGESVEAQVRVSTRGELRWHRLTADALRDSVTGEIGALIEHTDVSARVVAEDLAEDRGQTITALSDALKLVERQQQEILELSAPMLEVGDQTLAVPIIGRLDESQSEAIMTRLLDAVVARRVARVILDVTGLAGIDVGGARRLHQLIAGLELLGATTIVTGVRPQLALELVESGLDLEGVETLRSLAQGLRR